MKDYFKKLYQYGTDKFYSLAKDSLKHNKKMFVVTANPETFMYGTKDRKFNELLLDDNTTLVPDGIGIVKAARMLDYDIKERITGIDLASFLLNECNDNGYKLALLGAKEEVITALQEKIKKDYPNIIIVKAENGYNNNKDNFFKELLDLNPDVCLVALGIPNQEKLIYKHISKFKKGIFVGVGGSFDVLSGTKKRAPIIIQKLNIEWLYRIIKEPKRIKRFYNSNVKFIFKIKKNKNELKNN